jgi:Cof subfamily protein (haloacid dehalogenase superfamily)
MSQIKFIALDLDGTLLNSRGQISEENLTAIRLAEERGVLVTIATGRRFRDALPVGISAGLNAPLITHNGALTKFADTLEIVNVEFVPTQAAQKVLQIGRELGVDAMISADARGKGVLYYERLQDDNIPLKMYLAWSQRLHGAEAAEAVCRVADLKDVLREQQPIHLSFSGKCDEMRELNRVLEIELNNEIKTLATVYESQNFTLLDILNPSISKGYGVKDFARRHKIKTSEIMAIGDNFNDLDMLKIAGTPVVMGNAAPALQEQFANVTLSNDENGVAAAIKRFVLEKD